MAFQFLDPLTDERWPKLLAEHRGASVFHTREWLLALHRTYGFRPVLFGDSGSAGTLSNGIVFCEVRSWATGCRLVSLPFSDHCEPLVDSQEHLRELLGVLAAKRSSASWKYIELRPRHTEPESPAPDYAPDAEFFYHTLDLRPDSAELYRQLHPDCVRRKIRRAEREGLVYECGRSADLLHAFYALMILTRRRHGVPPQPILWFRNLVACMGERLQIRVARKGSVPVAAILTLAFRDTVTYKYGASDSRFHSLGGMPYLFWHAIQEAHAAGFSELDLGRSDLGNPGLLAFKAHLGAERRPLRYLRCPGRKEHRLSSPEGSGLRKRVCAVLPDSLFCALGRCLYPHCA